MPPDPTQRKLAAILSADVVGYSRLMAEDEDGTVRTLTAYREQIGTLVREHRGRVVDSPGDNVLAEFPTATAAVECAVEIQRVVAARNAGLSLDRKMEFRIGVHIGEVRAEGQRIYGDGVNIAARLEGLADAGGICISDVVHRQVEAKLNLTFDDLGEQSVKNIPRPVRVYRVLPGDQAAQEAAWTRWPRLAVASLVLLVAALGAVAIWRFIPTTQSIGQPANSVAVLPFANLSANPEEDEYFSDGIHDEIIAQLSKIVGVKVISRTSVMRYKGRDNRSLPEIGAELGVATILEGTVRWAERRLRITVQLVDARNDENLWTETYDRELTDIFAIQSDVAFRIAGALEAELSPSERERIERKPTESLEAYNLYLKGQYFWHRFTEEGKGKSIQYFIQARDKDPNFALAYVGLADAYGLIGCCSVIWGDVPPDEPYAKARQAAERALEIDSTLGAAYGALAMTMFASELDWVGAERAFKRAIELTPSDALAHTRYGLLLLALGRHDEAIARTKRAQELDPLAPIMSSDLAWAFLYADRNDEAVAEARRAIELEPAFTPGHHVLAEALLRQGRYEQAIAALRRAVELSPGGSRYLSQLAYAYAVSGDRTRAEELARELQNRSRISYVSPVSMAIVHAGLGESDKAIDALERAFETEDGFVALARTPFEFERLRSHPRFIALREKIGLSD